MTSERNTAIVACEI